MKKYIKVLVLLAVAVSLVACGKGKEESSGNDDQLNIVTSFYPMYDFTKNVVGDKANISILIDGGVDSHDYEPSAKDMAKIQDADVFVYNSNEMETWVESVLKNIDTSKVKVIEASEGIELLEGEDHEEEHDDHDHEEEEHSHEYDPHVWLNPVLAKTEVENISKGIIEVDSQNKTYYEENTTKYLEELTALDRAYQESFENAMNKKFVTQHMAFSYLAEQYDLEQIAITGISTDQEPTPKELKTIQDLVTEEKVDYIYTEGNSSEKIAKTISSATGAELATLRTMETVAKKERESGVDYLSIMKDNLEALKLSIN